MESQTLINLVVALIAVILFLVMIFTGIISAQFVLVLRHNKDYLRMAYEAANPQTQALLRTGATVVKQGADTLEDLATLAQEVVTPGQTQPVGSAFSPQTVTDTLGAALMIQKPGATVKGLPYDPPVEAPGEHG